jgi:tyrosinase
MAVVRSNIVTNPGIAQQFIQGVILLKQEFLGPSTTDFAIPGPAQQVSTYDLFVIWHHVAMMTFTPPTQMDRNAAHRSPVFLPWHRFMMILLEQHLQRVLNDPEFGLPYWDWATDGNLPANQQSQTSLWLQLLGEDGVPVSTGPFAFDPLNPASWRVRIRTTINGQLARADRGLRRGFGVQVPTLPTTQAVGDALLLEVYDESPWDTSTQQFRNCVEGWTGGNGEPHLHNRVHLWVGGDMLPSTSPNDPVFYLNHGNEDRIWEAWMAQHGRIYVPDQTEAATLLFQRIDDPMFALLSPPMSPRDVLDPAPFYSYDTLVVS